MPDGRLDKFMPLSRRTMYTIDKGGFYKAKFQDQKIKKNLFKNRGSKKKQFWRTKKVELEDEIFVLLINDDQFIKWILKTNLKKEF